PAAVTLGRAAPRPARTAAHAAITAAARTRDQAAAWVRAQVSRAAIVACDPAMCAALQAAGLPAADLLVLGTDTPDPMGADLVVATPAVRSQFGTRLAGVYAPTVLAQFGTGAARIAVRVTAPGGAQAYRELLARDAQARRNVAAQLLGNPGVRMSQVARGQVLAGRVDSRLLLLLPALATVHPVQVLAFADAGPGADPAVPLRAARLAGSAVPPGLTQAAYVAWLRGYVRGQRPPYDGRTSVTGTVVTIQFSSPSPLGLLSPS
ncbi:MAG TPA: hypothetical protein VK586_22275, partial [Streptosporangiaceae bacterium]|nr:hypothetical protein [Streptosporangiaceae bacterium]